MSDETAPAADFVFTFSYETYTDARKRGMMRPPDRILQTLMNADCVERLLVANPYRWAPSALARRVMAKNVPFPRSDRMWLHSPLRLARADSLDPAVVARQYAAYDLQLRRGAAKHGLSKPMVITTNPVVAGFAPLDWAGSVSYFARDDWLSSPVRQQYWPVYREAYSRIARRGIGVTAVSQEIIDRIDPTGPHAVVPNGVEEAEWTGPVPDAPAWFAAIPGPRAVYVGTLDTRLDVDGIAALAADRPELQIVLLGGLPDPSYIAGLRALHNVHVHSSVGRAELVATLRSAELCLLSHRRTPLTEAMSPLKVYEYLAAGSPVLATDLPPVRGIDDRVLLLPRVSDFASAVDRALALGPASEARREAFVRGNSWASRHQIVLQTAFAGANVSR